MALVKKYCYRSLLFLFVMQTLNLSINSIEFYNSSSKVAADIDDLDYIDSMVEFMFEDVMGFSKHSFDDHAYNNDIAKIQQNVLHLDLRTIQYPKLLADLKENNIGHFEVIISNEDAICLCYREVLPEPPQMTDKLTA